MKHLGARIAFILKYRTFKQVAEDPKNKAKIVVFHEGREVALPKRCPHQGGPLAQGSVRDGRLHCPWHGCYYNLDDLSFCSKSFAPGESPKP